MTRKERYRLFVEYFSKHNPEAQTELNYENPYQLLVAVILSAQCTDKRINQVTPDLFRQFPTSKHLAAAEFDDVFDLIKSVSYPNNKSKHLIGMAQKLEAQFNGIVPAEINELITLPGVGRKTANVIASVIYQLPAMAVDTHVFRVSKRLGLTINAKTPEQAEKQLITFIPEGFIAKAHHWLILHGRYICLARNPKCNECPIHGFCKSYKPVKALSE